MATLTDVLLAQRSAQEKGRVTAGIPSLSPERRAATTYRKAQQAKQQALVADANRRHDAATAPDGTRPRTEYDAQAGMELYPDQLIQRLLKLNRNLYFEPARHNHQTLGIYLLNATPEGDRRYLCGMYRERKMPEFTVVKWVGDPSDENMEQTVGWRNVLSKLIRARVISKARVEVAFGPPTRDSMLWQQLTS